MYFIYTSCSVDLLTINKKPMLFKAKKNFLKTHTLHSRALIPNYRIVI